MLYKYRKLIIISVVLIIIVTPILIYASYLNSIQKLTITFDSALVKKMELYNGEPNTGISSSLGTLNQVIEQGKEITLKKGTYTLKATGDSIKSKTIRVLVGDKPVTQKIDVDYSDTYLMSQLKAELPDILAALDRDSPTLKTLYSLNEGKLYSHGEWFGSTLNYTGKESLSRDRLRFVMKKEKGNWVLVTNPPGVTLSSKQYPQIPHDVLSKVNAIDLGLPVLIN